MAYKFASPYDWLTQAAQEWNADQLYQTLLQLALIAGSDELQDLFQNEMAEDGYFDEIKEG